MGLSSPRRLLLKSAERAELALSVHHLLHGGGTESADELVLEVGDTHVEPEPFHVGASEVGAEACAFEATSEVALLGGVTETSQPDVEPLRAEQIEVPPYGLRTADRHDGNALGAEIATAALGERFDRMLIADPFDEHDRTRLDARGRRVRGGNQWSTCTASRPLDVGRGRLLLLVHAVSSPNSKAARPWSIRARIFAPLSGRCRRGERQRGWGPEVFSPTPVRGQLPEFSWTVIATTGERFSDFAPYVASVNDAGTVAFQAALRDGGTGVFTGRGEAVAEAAGPALLAGVTSHPDLNGAGDTSFYGDITGGGQGVFLLRNGHLQTIADTRSVFASIGPLGPTMNEAGTVAFRADPEAGVSGIFAGDDAAVATVADTTGPWSRFDGLPVINRGGTVVFRADRKDGVQGVYAGRAGSIRTVAETGDFFETLAPFPAASDHGTVAFAATLRAGGAGIFTVDEGGRTTQIVNTDGAFETCRGALITGAGAVVCIATPPGGTLGLFAGPDPEADRILALGDPLLGSTVEDLASNPVSVNDDGQVAIRVKLTDGRQLILRADPVVQPE